MMAKKKTKNLFKVTSKHIKNLAKLENLIKSDCLFVVKNTQLRLICENFNYDIDLMRCLLGGPRYINKINTLCAKTEAIDSNLIALNKEFGNHLYVNTVDDNLQCYYMLRDNKRIELIININKLSVIARQTRDSRHDKRYIEHQETWELEHPESVNNAFNTIKTWLKNEIAWRRDRAKIILNSSDEDILGRIFDS